MASHHIAIAKASFSAGLLRPDPVSVRRDEITTFHATLDRTLLRCSPANIQTCKSWLLEHVISSSNRVGFLAKYLVALSGSLADGDTKLADAHCKISIRRKRLHILYLLNDLFHHTKYHESTSVAFSTLSASLQPYIVELIGLTASYDREKKQKHHKRLNTLLDIWDANGYYSREYIGKLREVVKNSALTCPGKASTAAEEARSEPISKPSARGVPFVMPSTHGDSTAPYYDLPAGNMVPHIIPNSTVPLHPDSIKPLQFLAGPADEKLVDAVKEFLRDANRIYGLGKPEHKDREVIDIDELGQSVTRDDTTGDIIDGETYYGWSRSFCRQMKRNKTQSRSRSSSLSRSPSRTSRRSRYSDSSDSQRLGSKSRSRSRTARRRTLKRRLDSQSRSRSRQRRGMPSLSPPPPQSDHHHSPPSNLSPHLASELYPIGGNIPVPPAPPCPPGYQGPWPPPPPAVAATANYPSIYPLPNGGNFPPVHMGQQQMPPGTSYFPPPDQGSGQSGYSRGWHR